MAIVLTDAPPTYSSIHGDLLFTPYEATKATDPVTYPDYKYVCDVYVNAVLIYRAKTFPEPVSKRGVFNIGAIVRAYVATQLVADVSGILTQEMGANEFYLDVQCKFGEEYLFTLTTNLLVDSSRRFYNHYNNQITGSVDETILAAKLDTPLTNRHTTATILLDTPKYFIPFFCSAGSLSVEVNVFNAANVSIDTGSYSLSTNAGQMQLLNLSPTAINTDEGSTLIGTTAAYYIVEIDGYPFRFDIVCEAIHDVYTIHFLNQYGGFDSMGFRKVSRKKYEVEKRSYSQQPFRISSGGVVEYANSGDVVNETKTAYASLFGQKMIITTDNLVDEEWVWLKELQFSPNIYVEIGGKLIPVTITGSTYEEKKWINDKIKPLQIEVEFGVRLNTQYR